MNERPEFLAPRARSTGLVVRALDEEVLIYDLERDKAHCLNRMTGLVWRHADGQTTVLDIAQIVEDELRTPVSTDAVWQALFRLGEDNLLEEQVEQPSTMSVMSRRQMVQTVGIALAVPLVSSLAIPEAASAASTCAAACAVNRDCPTTLVCPHCKMGQLGTNTCCGDGNDSCTSTATCCGGFICVTSTAKCTACLASGGKGCNATGHPCCTGTCVGTGPMATCVG